MIDKIVLGLNIMWKGMAGIFTVTIIIICFIILLNLFTKNKKNSD